MKRVNKVEMEAWHAKMYLNVKCHGFYTRHDCRLFLPKIQCFDEHWREMVVDGRFYDGL